MVLFWDKIITVSSQGAQIWDIGKENLHCYDNNDNNDNNNNENNENNKNTEKNKDYYFQKNNNDEMKQEILGEMKNTENIENKSEKNESNNVNDNTHNDNKNESNMLDDKNVKEINGLTFHSILTENDTFSIANDPFWNPYWVFTGHTNYIKVLFCFVFFVFFFFFQFSFLSGLHGFLHTVCCFLGWYVHKNSDSIHKKKQIKHIKITGMEI